MHADFLPGAIRFCLSRIAVQRLSGAFRVCLQPVSLDLTDPILVSPATVPIAPASLPRCPAARIHSAKPSLRSERRQGAIYTPKLIVKAKVARAGKIAKPGRNPDPASVSGDDCAFVTAAERVDTHYGASLRQLLVDGMDGTGPHVPAPGA